VYVPSETEDGAVIVRVLVKVGLPLDGLNENCRPLGEDEALSETVDVPLTSVTVIVDEPLPVRIIVSVDGLADIEKSKAATKLAVSLTGPPWIVAVMELLVEVTVPVHLSKT
jgi:hypothetical protein